MTNCRIGKTVYKNRLTVIKSPDESDVLSKLRFNYNNVMQNMPNINGFALVVWSDEYSSVSFDSSNYPVEVIPDLVRRMIVSDMDRQNGKV